MKGSGVVSAILGALLGAASVSSSSGPVVRLGYASYRGAYNETSRLNVWKSIRYAAPPVGRLRWQAPQPPAPAASCGHDITPAVEQPPSCPQSGAYGTPPVYGFNSGLSSEDCLFLNVYAAPGAAALPVLVWIHGGGHSVFGAKYDPSAWMGANDNAFVVVEMQYRLGAFGYLASPQVKARGRLNAGLLDQRFALEWVQKHIAKFGGDASRVTVAGESSGAASAMFQAMAYGGNDSGLFHNVFAASPYTPAVHGYADAVPLSNHDSFAQLAGCGDGSAGLEKHQSVFDCLLAADTEALQNASGTVSTTRGHFGSFAFGPVVDGDMVQRRPSEQLLLGQVGGQRLLVGNNANEGVPLTDPHVKTRQQYDKFVSTTFPGLTAADVALLNARYGIDEAERSNDGARFDTLGDSGPTALTQSGMATGLQQAVFNMVGEAVEDCPAQWLAEAYSTGTRKAWKYQYSVTPSYHGADLSAYFPDGAGRGPSADFRRAFQKMLGSFVVNGDPAITAAEATGNATNATAPTAGGWLHWPAYSTDAPLQMDLNTTGGVVSLVRVTEDLSFMVRKGPGVVNWFRLVDALAWEGGRGVRCDFWRAVAARVPR